MSKKLKLAWFTPHQQQSESLSSVFSNQILPELRKKAEITIFTDDFQEYSDESGSYQTFHYLRAAERQTDFDIFIYQVENHIACNFMRFHLGQIPGLVIFHHLNFLSLGPDPLLNSPHNKIKAMMEQGVWPKRDDKFPRKPPLPTREAAFCILPVFTNPQYITDFNNQNFTSLAKDYNLSAKYLPFAMSVGSALNDSLANRLTLATPAKIGTSERIVKILKSLARLPQLKLNWLIDLEEEAQARDLISEFEVEEQVDLTTGRTIANWESVLSQSTIAIHLQYSAYDQPAPYLMQSMLAGRPVITNRNSYSEFLNDNLVFKLSSGVSEQAELTELLKSWPGTASEKLAVPSREFAENHYDPKLVATEFYQMIESNQVSISNFYADWQKFQARAKEQLATEMKNLYQENLDLPELKASWDYFASSSVADITGGQISE